MFLVLNLFRYADAGQGWSQPEIIGEDRKAGRLSLDIGVDGALHLVWAEEVDEIPGPDWISYTTRTDENWDIGIIVVDTGSGSVFGPQIAIDQASRAHIIWGADSTFPPSSFRGNRIFHGTLDSGFPSPIERADTVVSARIRRDFIAFFDVLVDDSNTVYVYWSASKSGQKGYEGQETIWLRTLRGAEWSLINAPLRSWELESNGTTAFWPNMSVGPENSLHMVFIGSEDDGHVHTGTGFLNFVYYSENAKDDTPWRDPILVHGDRERPDFLPQIRVDRKNTRHVFWLADADANYWPDTLYYSFSHDGENWSEPFRLSSFGGTPLHPRITLDSQDTLHVIWLEHLPGDSSGCPQAKQMIYRRGLGHAWHSPDIVLEDCLRSVLWEDLVIDTNDRLHLVWIERTLNGENSGRINYSSKPLRPLSVQVRASFMPGEVTIHNYPNPFNASTTIQYYLPETSVVTLKIFDPTGREIAILATGTEEAGNHNMEWDGTDARGSRVASGIYVYRLGIQSSVSDKEFHMTRKMVLLR